MDLSIVTLVYQSNSHKIIWLWDKIGHQNWMLSLHQHRAGPKHKSEKNTRQFPKSHRATPQNHPYYPYFIYIYILYYIYIIYIYNYIYIIDAPYDKPSILIHFGDSPTKKRSPLDLQTWISAGEGDRCLWTLHHSHVERSGTVADAVFF